MSKSRTTTKHKDGHKLQPISQGEILRAEFLEPLGLSANKLALHMGVPATRVTAILSESERRAITANTAYRLARVFKTSPQFWLNLQSRYEMEMLDFTGAIEKINKEARSVSNTAQDKLQ